MQPTPFIHLTHVYKDYPQAKQWQTVLHDINLTIHAHEFVAIVGASGNGKSTLLNLLSGIDTSSKGEVWVNNTPLHAINNAALTRWRGANVGIIFQFFQLLPTLNLWQNIVLPMDFLNILPKRQRRERAMHLLELVDLTDAAQRLPSEVSGGQQQRAAIARALANDPALIVADEPTGNLDAHTADAVFHLFSHLQSQGKTLVMVTHNESLAAAAPRKITVSAGRIASDTQAQTE
ncbi:MAG: ABC transporter ATP-binding protein [Methylovulum sp.]|jgi:putative ABC transport system ATP-binding protein